MQGWRRALVAWLPVLGLLLAAGPAPAAEKTIQRVARATAAATDLDDDGNGRVIVKYRQGSTLARSRQGAQQLGQQLQLPMTDGHVLGARSQSLRARGIGAQALATRLAAQADVEWAVPVRRKTVRAVLPNDPLFADGQTTVTPVVGQWYLRAPDATVVSAINAVGAWAITEGSAGITVAVLDTGVRYDHPDLAGKLRPGYDFVSRSSTANDDGGRAIANSRDADANDPGDWSTSSDSCGASNSSWHGTQVAGLIGAATDNGIGMAGAGRNTMVLPVRVLGRCGGFDDDIQAGMRWAGGLSNAAGCTSSSAATPTCNPYPARVLNMSLGSSDTCSVPYRDVIADLNAAGVVVMVAAGNGDSRVPNSAGRAVDEPANCPGAIAVSGVRHAGTKVGYSNLGPQVAIAAPAGNCVNLTGNCLYPLVTTLNAGTTTPGAHIYSDGNDPSIGTSFAAPIVAGAVGLMLAVDPTLTPAQVKTTLQATARAFPTTGAQEPGTVACRAPDATDQIECYCTTSTCGAGLLDVGAAVAAVQAAPTAVITVSTTTPTAGDAVSLSGTGSTATSGRTLSSYQWALPSGAGIASFTGATDGSTASLATSGAGTVVVQLTVTDSAGTSRSTRQTITVAAAPVVVTPPPVTTGTSSGGGGGAMGAGWVLGLLVAAVLLARRPPRRRISATR
jgi:serine protease